MANFTRKNRGAGLIGWIVILCFIGALGLLGLRLFPAYFESLVVGSALSSLAKDPISGYGARSTLVEYLARRFQVNNVKNVNAKDLKIEKKEGQGYFILDYEVRVHAIWNIDCVMVFHKSAKVK